MKLSDAEKHAMSADVPKGPRVGVSVVILMSDGVVMLKRQGTTLAPGTWCFPGGHVEHGETVEAAARREVMEEVGVKIYGEMLKLPFTEEFYDDGRHYITFHYVGMGIGKPTIIEPEKASEMFIGELCDIPSPLFPGTDPIIAELMKKDSEAALFYRRTVVRRKEMAAITSDARKIADQMSSTFD